MKDSKKSPSSFLYNGSIIYNYHLSQQNKLFCYLT